MTQLTLKIVTPEKEVYSDLVDIVTLPSAEGELTILPEHANLIAKLAHGELRIKKSGKMRYLALGEGFMQVVDNNLTILTDLAEDAEDINEKAIEEAKIRAERALEQKLSDEEHADTLAVLEKSLTQLKVKRRHRNL